MVIGSATSNRFDSLNCIMMQINRSLGMRFVLVLPAIRSCHAWDGPGAVSSNAPPSSFSSRSEAETSLHTTCDNNRRRRRR